MEIYVLWKMGGMYVYFQNSWNTVGDTMVPFSWVLCVRGKYRLVN